MHLRGFGITATIEPDAGFAVLKFLQFFEKLKIPQILVVKHLLK